MTFFSLPGENFYYGSKLCWNKRLCLEKCSLDFFSHVCQEILTRLQVLDEEKKHLVSLLALVGKESPKLSHAVLAEKGKEKLQFPTFFDQPCGFRTEGMDRSPGDQQKNLGFKNLPKASFVVEFSGLGTQGQCRQAGPFPNMDQATKYAHSRGQWKHAPRDGWYQVVDRNGTIRVIT
jgi:hypothetical protein